MSPIMGLRAASGTASQKRSFNKQSISQDLKRRLVYENVTQKVAAHCRQLGLLNTKRQRQLIGDESLTVAEHFIPNLGVSGQARPNRSAGHRL